MAFLTPFVSPDRRLTSIAEHPCLTEESSLETIGPSDYRRSEAVRRACQARGRPYQVGLTAQLPFSYLELASIGERTVKDYRARLLDLYAWSSDNGMTWSCAAASEMALA